MNNDSATTVHEAQPFWVLLFQPFSNNISFQDRHERNENGSAFAPQYLKPLRMKIIFFVVSMLLCRNLLCAQQKGSRVKTNPRAQAKAVKSTLKTKDNREAITLRHTGSNAAKSTTTSTPIRLQIADPVILTLKERASGVPVASGQSPIIGAPRGTYGFANGRVVFYPNVATSSGTSTGNGSVGTGTSPGAVGAFGPAMGVNGKSPYAGPGTYGARIPLISESKADSGGRGPVRKIFPIH
jgi:hypothetical protein